METDIIKVPQIAENPSHPDVTEYFQLRQGDFVMLLNSTQEEDRKWLGKRRLARWFLESNGEELTEWVLRDIPNAAKDLAQGNQEPAVDLLKKDLDRLVEDLAQSTTGDKRAFVVERIKIALAVLAGLVGEEQIQQERFQRLGIRLSGTSL